MSRPAASHPPEASRAFTLGAIKISFALLPLSLALFAYERTLVPIYGSAPTEYLLNKILLATTTIAAFEPIKISCSRNILLAGLLLTIAPNATYWLAVLTARKRDPILGPALTHLLAIAPVGYVFATFVAKIEVTKVRANDSRLPLINGLTAVAIYSITRFLKGLCPSIPYIDNISDSEIFLGLAGAAFATWIWAFFSLPSSRKNRKQSKGLPSSSTTVQTKVYLVFPFIALWFFIHTKLSSPVLPHPLSQPYTHPTFPLQIYTSVQSTTGLIVVGEALPPPSFTGEDDGEMHSVRYLRASHSILGGVWTGAKIMVLDDTPPWNDSFGTPLGDSIYSTFVLQEAVRLINSTTIGKKGSFKNALIIGLGTGISATAFNRHNIATTIIEIDPAVYEASRRYFGLPDPGPGKVFLEDARTWVAQQRMRVEAGINEESLYDFVVHDCFSGGGVPQHIFTMEFWEDLKTVIHPGGVVVVNFAGKASSETSRAIFFTLEKTFGQCRIFHDSFDDLPEEKYETEFINMVIFCSSTAHPLTFRRARNSDYLGSPLRRHVLSTLPEREIDLSVVRGGATRGENQGETLILTDDHNPLGRWQDDLAFHHWTLMREVLEDVFWETH